MNQSTADAIEAIRQGAVPDTLEGDRLDFKEPADVKETLRILADASVCFANAVGGDIVLGVRDKAGGPQAFTGVPSGSRSTVCAKVSSTEPAPPSPASSKN